MSEPVDKGSGVPSSPSASPPPFIMGEAGRQLRAPWAASVAGILFAVMFTAGLVLLRGQSIVHATTDSELADYFATGKDTAAVIGGLYLLPIAGVMFLWFVAVIRDQVGEREDRFFATIFFGSGLLFVATLFAATAAAVTPLVAVRYLGLAPPTEDAFDLLRALSYTLMFAFGTRAAAVFMIATATIGIKSGVFPRWFAIIGYVFGVILLVAVAFWDWFVLVLPAWVAVVSLFILKRERARRHAG